LRKRNTINTNPNNPTPPLFEFDCLFIAILPFVLVVLQNPLRFHKKYQSLLPFFF
jgi:hypothetical protein